MRNLNKSLTLIQAIIGIIVAVLGGLTTAAFTWSNLAHKVDSIEQKSLQVADKLEKVEQAKQDLERDLATIKSDIEWLKKWAERQETK